MMTVALSFNVPPMICKSKSVDFYANHRCPETPSKLFSKKKTRKWRQKNVVRREKNWDGGGKARGKGRGGGWWRETQEVRKWDEGPSGGNPNKKNLKF
jgi:hypothetical protein